ncbi:hypothetical protein EFM11_01200 [Lactobacillus helveticus]|nr:hypothetical protein [Lactobacillus helveticus]MCT0164186.1 hypothetical protein [Lactobacillus helveticus]
MKTKLNKPYRVLVSGMTPNPGGVESLLMNYYRKINKDKIHFDFLCNTLEKISFEDEIKGLGGFKPKYFYNIRSNSITTRKFTPEKLDLLKMTDKMADDVVRKYPDLKRAVLRRRIYARFSTLNQTLTSKNTVEIKKIRNELIKFIQKNHKELFLDKNVPKRDKAAYLSLCMGFNFYKCSWNLYSKIVK